MKLDVVGLTAILIVLALAVFCRMICRLMFWAGIVDQDPWIRWFSKQLSSRVSDAQWRARFQRWSVVELGNPLRSADKAEQHAAAERLLEVLAGMNETSVAGLSSYEREVLRIGLELHSEYPRLAIEILRIMRAHGVSADLDTIGSMLQRPAWKQVRIAAENTNVALRSRLHDEATLLRPAARMDEDRLLRPVSPDQSADADLLLRPSTKAETDSE